MQRLYLTTKAKWQEYHEKGRFNPIVGSHYEDLDDGHVILQTDVSWYEYGEDEFHADPEVGVIPSLAYYGNTKMSECVTEKGCNESHPFAKHTLHQSHLDALRKHVDIKPDDTVNDFYKKVGKWRRAFGPRPIY